MHAPCVEGNCFNGRVGVGLCWVRLGGGGYRRCLWGMLFVSRVVGGCGWWVWGVMLLFVFSISLVVVRGVSKGGRVGLLWGCQFQRFALLEA